MKYKVGDIVLIEAKIIETDNEAPWPYQAEVVGEPDETVWLQDRHIVIKPKNRGPRAGLRPVEWVVGSKKGTGYFHKFDMGVAVIECENGNVIYTGQLRFTDVPEVDNAA